MIIFFKKHFRHYSFLYSSIITLVIILKGLMTYIVQKMRACRTSEVKVHRMKFLIVSDGRNLSDMKEIAERHNFRYDIFHSRLGDMPSTDVLFRDYDYIVFDTSRYPYSAILDFFRHDDPARKRPLIATYIPSSRSIMTFHGALK